VAPEDSLAKAHAALERGKPDDALAILQRWRRSSRL